jgi:hypothetical protein
VHSQPKCAYRKKDGEPCKAYAREDDQFCFFHSPGSTRDRREAQKAGGTTRGRQNTAIAMREIPDNPLHNSADICGLLSTTINEVRSGRLQPRIATAVGYLANILLAAQEHGPLEDRLSRLETVLRMSDGSPQKVAAPVAVIERRVGQHVIGLEVRMPIGVEGVAVGQSARRCDEWQDSSSPSAMSCS